MSTRLCGYCRGTGHNYTACEERLGLIDTIRRHVGSERRRIVEMMIAGGFGVGALVEAWSYEDGCNVTCVITDPNAAAIGRRYTLVEYRNVKYSKKVRVDLGSLSGYFPESNLVANRILGSYGLLVTPLTGASSSVATTINAGQLPAGMREPSALAKTPSHYGWDRYVNLLVPSYDGEVDIELLNEKFRLHDRLTRDHEFVTPIF